ncbi:SulP family inorganic anion transporter [Sandaracinus amylolyticus]|uniref:SulP family inorganic anion transporter n=1 Tax=Sandaracinus amylolyticus TaxID=927083 RepID=UPI001EEC93FC|nr:SulP family inorganic anion transporter [Sandaracinus amylolyticus]UJR84959.1 Hypothetical protein I5071_70380 [Sandaracinus amylolyticus]
MFDRRTAGANVGAGLVVAMVAIPLNLALAVACDLPPAAGLVSGAIGGLIASLFGGSRLNVTGPEVALAPLTAAIVATHGIDGMLIATAIAGAVQIALGVLRVGGLVRLLPRPVVGGFLAAVGVMVFDSQLPHLIGVHDGRRVAALAIALPDVSPDVLAIAIGAVVMLVLIVLPRVAPRVPAPLVALSLAVGVVAWLGLDVERVAPLHGNALALHVPSLDRVDLAALVPSALALAALASVDSLLCAVSIDARTGGPAHRPDQELVAQGVANLACAAFGGMPVAAAVVRSVAAIEARGSTRLCGVVQSIVLLAVVLVLGPHLDVVPLAALSGVLLVVGAKLIDLSELAKLAKVRRFEAIVFVATAIAIVTTGFVEGLLIGFALAVVEHVSAQGAALRLDTHVLGRTRVARLEGPLVFASQHRAQQLVRGIPGDETRALVIELEGVTHWDASGIAALRTALSPLAARGTRIEVVPGDAVPVDALERDLAGIAQVRARRESNLPRPSEGEARSGLDALALDGAE